MRRTTISIVAALATVGCSASNENAAPDPTPSTVPTTAAADTATVEQWASLVAPFAREWNDQVEQTEDDCLDPLTLFACTAGYYILGANAARYVIILEGAQDIPDVDHYLGEPPAEIADLIDDTVETAEAVDPAVTTWQETGCDDPLSLDCGVVESLTMDMAVGDLTEAFDAWAPYL
jgi:ABC-type phosphate transport system substrate-binding protein